MTAMVSLLLLVSSLTLIQATHDLFAFTVEEAAQWAHEAIMANHGQNCCAGSRTYVQESIYDKFVAICKTQAENRIVGDPFDEVTMHGPQVTDAHPPLHLSVFMMRDTA